MDLASSVDVDVAISNLIKKNLANDVSTFPVKSKPVFINRPSSLPRKLHDCILLEICVFNNYTSAD